MKKILTGVLATGLCLALAGTTMAQQYPARPINVIVGFAAGSTTDTIARYYTQALADKLSQPLIVQNRPGASQLAAITELKGAAADGHNIMMITGSASSQGPGVRDDLPYNTLEDFVPIAMVATAQGVFVANKDLPFNDIAGLVAYAKEHPGELNYGSSGLGSASNLQIELLKSITGIDMVHIPFAGSGEIMNAIIAGEIDIGLGPIQGAASLVNSRQLKAIGVTGSKSVDGMPDAQPLSSSEVPGLSVLDPYTYYLIIAPAGTPQPVVDQLHAAFNATSEKEDTVTAMHRMGFEPLVISSEEAVKRVTADIEVWRDFREQTGFTWGK